jgi:hypothetical protein
MRVTRRVTMLCVTVMRMTVIRVIRVVRVGLRVMMV